MPCVCNMNYKNSRWEITKRTQYGWINPLGTLANVPWGSLLIVSIANKDHIQEAPCSKPIPTLILCFSVH